MNKFDKLDEIKIFFLCKRPCCEHEEIMKRLAADCKKIFASHIFNKGLVCRIYKNSQNPTVKNKAT